VAGCRLSFALPASRWRLHSFPPQTICIQLPWVLAVPVALILDLLLYTGVTDAKARLGPLLTWLTHNFGWQGWVFQGQVAFGLLCLVVVLRVPWTRAKLVFAEALDRDQALPPELRETIDDRVGEAILPRGRSNPGLRDSPLSSPTRRKRTSDKAYCSRFGGGAQPQQCQWRSEVVDERKYERCGYRLNASSALRESGTLVLPRGPPGAQRQREPTWSAVVAAWRTLPHVCAAGMSPARTAVIEVANSGLPRRYSKRDTRA
jgi:hypothetical protein